MPLGGLAGVLRWGLGLLFNVADGLAPALLGALMRAFRRRLSVVFACAGRRLFAEATGRFLVGAGMVEIVGNGPMPPHCPCEAVGLMRRQTSSWPMGQLGDQNGGSLKLQLHLFGGWCWAPGCGAIFG